MRELLGRTFSVAEGEYRVVDVRQLSGEVMVYAESTSENRNSGRRPGSSAVRWSIAGLAWSTAEPASGSWARWRMPSSRPGGRQWA